MSRHQAPVAYLTGPFSLGSVCCPLCGQFFSLSTNCATQHARCRYCGTACSPTPGDAAALFTFNELVSGATGHPHGPAKISTQTHGLDQRQTEEAFCDKCKKQTTCFVYAVQIRSADEGQTIIYQCGVCKQEWMLNS